MKHDHSIVVGSSGTGSLTISDGATVNVVNGTGKVELAWGENSAGTINIGAAEGDAAVGAGRLEAAALEFPDGDAELIFIHTDTDYIFELDISGTGDLTHLAGTTTLTGNSEFAGNTAVDGGTMIIAGTLSDTIGVIGDDEGTDGAVLVTGAGSNWTSSQTVLIGDRGTGRLTITEGGTVYSITGTIGFTEVADCTVLVTGEGSSFTTRSGMRIADEGVGRLTIADGGMVNVGGGSGQVRVADDATSLGIINIGAAEGDEAVGAGTLEAGRVQFGEGDGRIVFNHTDTDYIFAPTITGSGEVAFYSGTTLFNGENDYSGGTTLWGGQLIVNGSITGETIIYETGFLGGSGTVGAITVNAGGTLAPGNSIGTLGATDVNFEEGSRYAVEVNAAGQSDLLAATGAVSIAAGAILDVSSETLDADGSAFDNLNTNYTIITADSGLTGAFDTVTDSFAFLDAELRYDANAAYLNLLRNDLAFADVVRTPNQIATAGGVDSLSADAPLYDEILGLDLAEVAPAFDALSGEAHASAKTHLIQNGAVIADAILANMRSGTASAELSPEVSQMAHSGTPDSAAWGVLIGSLSETDATSNTATLEQTHGGAVAGVEVIAFSDLQLGFVLGISGSDYDVADRLSSGTVRAAYLGVYGSGDAGPLDLRFGATFGAHEIESERRVTVGPTTDELIADYDAQSTTLFAEVSYAIPQLQL